MDVQVGPEEGLKLITKIEKKVLIYNQGRWRKQEYCLVLWMWWWWLLLLPSLVDCHPPYI